MNIFYSHKVQWFENVANGSIWLIIVSIAACLIWIGYDVVKGSALPEGFSPIADSKISSHKASANKADINKTNKIETKTDDKATTSPFAPGKRKLTAKP